MLRALTLWLALVLTLMGAMLQRWRFIRRQEEEGAGATADGGSAASGTQPVTAMAAAASPVQEEQLRADLQLRGLFRVVVILVAALGSMSIWTDILPSLQMFKRIEVWPEFAWRDTGMDLLAGLPSASATATAVGLTAPSAPAAASSEQPSAPLPLLPAATSASGEAAQEASPITLWLLGEALILAFFTVILFRDIPGVLDLSLLRRTGLDPGARIALLTLVRYFIAMVGSLAVFGTLGISWSNIQWLAAALTFGLGFGLQEIVANFVSGIILLVERPVRVGDAVTIGNLSGLVTRIRIRSTRISLWDRSEMIVPNKEFITQKLINWTLSDSRTRVDVPVRVAYGTDVAAVKRVLIDVAHGHDASLTEPEPKALLIDFGESYMQFELWVFVDYAYGRVRAKDELQVGVDQAFREAGIGFALPSYRVQSDAAEGKAIAPPPKTASGEPAG